MEALRASWRESWDIWLWALLILSVNASLIAGGQPNVALALLPERVAAGEVWRLVTHPLVHVTRYHLVLDGVAFLLLLRAAVGYSPVQRLLLVICASAASAAFATLRWEELATHGLGGLSGAAHGLMVATAIPLLRARGPERALAWGALVVVSLKALVEAVSGHVVLEVVHVGSLGVPNSLCHLGGVVGGAAMGTYLTTHRLARDEPTARDCAAREPSLEE